MMLSILPACDKFLNALALIHDMNGPPTLLLDASFLGKPTDNSHLVDGQRI